TRSVTALESAFSVGSATNVINVDAATSSTARTNHRRAPQLTAVTRNKCTCAPPESPASLTMFTCSLLLHFSAPVSLCSTRFVPLMLRQVHWSPCRASAGLAISRCSTPRDSDTELLLSRGAVPRERWHRRWGPTTTSTATLPTLRANC